MPITPCARVALLLAHLVCGHRRHMTNTEHQPGPHNPRHVSFHGSSHTCASILPDTTIHDSVSRDRLQLPQIPPRDSRTIADLFSHCSSEPDHRKRILMSQPQPSFSVLKRTFTLLDNDSSPYGDVWSALFQFGEHVITTLDQDPSNPTSPSLQAFVDRWKGVPRDFDSTGDLSKAELVRLLYGADHADIPWRALLEHLMDGLPHWRSYIVILDRPHTREGAPTGVSVVIGKYTSVTLATRLAKEHQALQSPPTPQADLPSPVLDNPSTGSTTDPSPTGASTSGLDSSPITVTDKEFLTAFSDKLTSSITNAIIANITTLIDATVHSSVEARLERFSIVDKTSSTSHNSPSFTSSASKPPQPHYVNNVVHTSSKGIMTYTHHGEVSDMHFGSFEKLAKDHPIVLDEPHDLVEHYDTLLQLGLAHGVLLTPLEDLQKWESMVEPPTSLFNAKHTLNFDLVYFRASNAI